MFINEILKIQETVFRVFKTFMSALTFIIPSAMIGKLKKSLQRYVLNIFLKLQGIIYWPFITFMSVLTSIVSAINVGISAAACKGRIFFYTILKLKEIIYWPFTTFISALTSIISAVNIRISVAVGTKRWLFDLILQMRGIIYWSFKIFMTVFTFIISVSKLKISKEATLKGSYGKFKYKQGLLYWCTNVLLSVLTFITSVRTLSSSKEAAEEKFVEEVEIIDKIVALIESFVEIFDLPSLKYIRQTVFTEWLEIADFRSAEKRMQFATKMEEVRLQTTTIKGFLCMDDEARCPFTYVFGIISKVFPLALNRIHLFIIQAKLQDAEKKLALLQILVERDPYMYEDWVLL